MPEFPFTLGIIAVTVLVSLIALRDQRIFNELLFYPAAMQGGRQLYRMVTHGLLHADMFHLLVNMYVLFNFGRAVEQTFESLLGSNAGIYFVLFYICGIVLSALPGYYNHRHNPQYRAVGASGATSAVLFAFVLLHPEMRLSLLLLPIPMPAWVFGGLYLGYEWYMSRRGNTGIAHDAHYFGALYGVAVTALLVPGSVGHFLRTVLPGA